MADARLWEPSIYLKGYKYSWNTNKGMDRSLTKRESKAAFPNRRLHVHKIISVFKNLPVSNAIGLKVIGQVSQQNILLAETVEKVVWLICPQIRLLMFVVLTLVD